MISAVRGRVALVLAVSSALAGPACAQTLGQGEGVDLPWWRVAGALGLCLALAVGAALALKARLGGGASGLPAWLTGGLSGLPAGRPARARRRLLLVESVRLNQNVDLCLLKLDETEFVVAATAQGAVLLPVCGPAGPAAATP